MTDLNPHTENPHTENPHTENPHTENPHTENPHIDDALFDRLVDGEFGADEKRRLIASLDDEPSGWRRCALAFLEAQAWRGTLGDVINESVATASASNARAIEKRPVVATQPQVLRQSKVLGQSKVLASTAEYESTGFSAWKPLAIAAGIMLAFTFGMVWRSGMQNGVQHPDPPRFATRVDQPGSLIVPPQRIDEAPARQTPHSLVRNSAGLSRSPGSYITVPPDDAVVFLVGGNGSPERQIQVPLIESASMNEQFGRHLQPAVPDNLRQWLEQQGFRVETRRRYAPVQAGGGQQLLVPVDDTKIVPVMRTVY